MGAAQHAQGALAGGDDQLLHIVDVPGLDGRGDMQYEVHAGDGIRPPGVVGEISSDEAQRIAVHLTILHLPAFVEGRYLNVLAVNPLATAISLQLVVGANRLRDLFLDPASQTLFPDWELATRDLIAGFRQSVGADIDDPRVIELVGELSLASPHFRHLWARHDVRPMQSGRMRFDHPQVGWLVVNYEKLSITGTEGMKLVMLHADPGSEDADKLALLGSATLPPANSSSRAARLHEA